MSEDKDNKINMEITSRKLVRVGGSLMISVPPKWLEQHEYKEGEEITIMVNNDLKMLSPETKKKFYTNAFKEEIKKNE